MALYACCTERRENLQSNKTLLKMLLLNEDLTSAQTANLGCAW